MKVEIQTKAGRIPLVALEVYTTQKVETGTEYVIWTTTYRFKDEIVREDFRESSNTMMTTEGFLPARDLSLKIYHLPATCGLAIASEYWIEGKLVRRDIEMEVYDPPSMTGSVG